MNRCAGNRGVQIRDAERRDEPTARTYLVGMIEIAVGEESSAGVGAQIDEFVALLAGPAARSNPRHRYIFPATRVSANLDSLVRDLNRRTAELRDALASGNR